MIVLPFPPASLSGHNTGHWREKGKIVSSWRGWAVYATKGADVPPLPSTGDIDVLVRFFPPNRRGDRTNFPNRMKPILDGVAQALRVNDKRFVPRFEFHPPEKPGRVEIILSVLTSI